MNGLLLSYASAEICKVPRFYRVWHRTMDLLCGLLGLLTLLLLFPLVACCIALDSRGPIVLRQQRVGYGGQVFTMYKFRSMYRDAEVTGARMAVCGDARVTHVGRWLRATHLDELPQVLNILRGEMSVIGPRPEREPFSATLAQMLPLFPLRLLVRPGLTGLAQVHCSYAATVEEMAEKLRYDLAYIQRWSPYLDIAILGATVREVCCGKGR